MALTVPWEIQLFDDTFPSAPLENLLNLQSNNLNAALTSGFNSVRQSIGSRVANQAARDALFPGTPAQGSRVWRTDKGWEEAYFAAYHATNNPAGAVTAGWYPIAGNMPFYYASGVSSQPVGSNAQSLLGQLWGQASTHKYKDFAPVSGTSGVFVVPMNGVYEIEAQVRIGGASQAVLSIMRNDTTGNMSNPGGIARADSVGPAIYAHKNAYLRSGDALRFWLTQTMGVVGNPSLQIFDTFVSLRYQGPSPIEFGAN